MCMQLQLSLSPEPAAIHKGSIDKGEWHLSLQSSEPSVLDAT